MKLQVKKLNPNATIPTRGSAKASGLDLYALEDVAFNVGDIKLVKTGIAFGIPEGYEVQVRPRSGISLKTGLIIRNSPGTLDQDYTGECGVIMQLIPDKSGDFTESYTIKKGDRIAQAVLCPVVLPEVEEVEELSDTVRGAGGFGSTGK